MGHYPSDSSWTIPPWISLQGRQNQLQPHYIHHLQWFQSHIQITHYRCGLGLPSSTESQLILVSSITQGVQPTHILRTTWVLNYLGTSLKESLLLRVSSHIILCDDDPVSMLSMRPLILYRQRSQVFHNKQLFEGTCFFDFPTHHLWSNKVLPSFSFRG